MDYWAHSKEGQPPGNWHPLDEHLQCVADRAAEFAKPFGGEQWAYLAGLWHDLGKYSNEFQKKLYDANGIENHLETKPGRVIHSEAGGHWAQNILSGGLERIFCWLIMGHHAGLADYGTADSGARALEPKMRSPDKSNSILQNVPDSIKKQHEPPPPKALLNKADISFFIRMLFSCLVDADFLDTEAFMDEGNKQLRNEVYPEIEELLTSFDEYMNSMCSEADRTNVNTIRAEVLEQCRNAAENEPGVFTLTVPTGGGKTLSSLAFSLRHAIKWGKNRIIYVIPYTSIIEQTAQVFRKIPGFKDAVLENHCNVSTHDESSESIRSRLAAENWDAPIIVTTSVQFFESLYACKTSRCRKLHNIANSVVIFDEAQCLPPRFIRPAVFAIRELCLHYDVTPVICTATQPVLTQSESFDFKFREGFESVTEIIDNPAQLSDGLQRVSVERFRDLQPVAYETVAESMLAENKSALCIVNRKNDARELYGMLPEEQTIHLSTNMCAEHRLKALETIREWLLETSNLVFVVSTSLVEAGVDLDFPVVYRALAGLDSIAQAAGRCNREGTLSGFGKTVVFVPENQPNYVQSPASLAHEYLAKDHLDSIFNPETFQSYFTQRFFQIGEASLDEHNILELLANHRLEFNFRTAAERFRLIDDSWQSPLIVPVGEAPELVDKLIQYEARSVFRKLQRYTISIPKRLLLNLVDEGHAHELKDFPGSYYLDNIGLYDERFGFTPPEGIDCYDPELTIA